MEKEEVIIDETVYTCSVEMSSGFSSSVQIYLASFKLL